MKTFLLVVAAMAFFAFGCNKSKMIDSEVDVQREETYDKNGNLESYQIEEERVTPKDEHIQKQDERNVIHEDVDIIEE